MNVPESRPGTVLILGADGRLGRHAIDAFARKGWHVRTFTRRAPGSPGDHVVGDALDAEAVTAAAGDCDVLVNAVSPPQSRWTRDVPILTEAVISAAVSVGATIMLPGSVHGFGRTMPPRLTSATPDAPSNAFGRVRAELEERYRSAAEEGGRTILVRSGSFIESRRTGNWFESQIVKRIEQGRVLYPGPLDRSHAWAWLPDLGRAFADLAECRERLNPFHVVGFSGWSLTGAELVDALQRVSGRTLAIDSIPWPLLRLATPFSSDLRGAFAMRYLWEVPHAIDGAELERLLPAFRATPVEEALHDALVRLRESEERPDGRRHAVTKSSGDRASTTIDAGRRDAL